MHINKLTQKVPMKMLLSIDFEKIESHSIRETGELDSSAGLSIN